MKSIYGAWFVTLVLCMPLAQATDKPAAPAAANTTTKAAPKSAEAKQTAVVAVPVPADVLAEMDKLVEKAVQLAAAPLQKSDAFLPYAVVQYADGTLKELRWTLKQTPATAEVLRRMRVAAATEAKKPEVMAVVVVAVGSVPANKDKGGTLDLNGLTVDVDHRRGEPRAVFMPYLREKGKPVFGTLVYLPGAVAFFEHGKPAAKPAVKSQ